MWPTYNEGNMTESDMNEQSNNNLPVESFEEAEQLDDEFIPDDAQPLCPKCLRPCNPLQHYCSSCDSNGAINPLTLYIPFVNIRFNYGGFCTMWRKIWYDKDTSKKCLLCYFFIFIMFAPFVLIIGLPLFLIGKNKNARL